LLVDACLMMIYEKHEFWRVVCDIAWTLSTHSVGALAYEVMYEERAIGVGASMGGTSVRPEGCSSWHQKQVMGL